MDQRPISIAIHGGAGTILRSSMTPEKEAAYRDALTVAIRAGHSVLSQGGTALDAVETAVRSLEDCPLFNAGRGSVFTAKGTHEMDASIMCGQTRQAGAVSMVSGVRNPVSLARAVMERSGHVLLAGAGALEFAHQQNCAMEPAAYFHVDQRYDQWLAVKDTDGTLLDHSDGKDRKFGTVGCVALDVHGNLAAATSTGGMTNKKFGRIGDSPIIGCGNYANNRTCAVSCTGSGEFFIRGVVAYDISCLMEYRGLSVADACKEVVHHRLLDLGGDGGLIAMDARGNYHLDFNTEGMYRAAIGIDGQLEVGIYGGETRTGPC